MWPCVVCSVSFRLWVCVTKKRQLISPVQYQAPCVQRRRHNLGQKPWPHRCSEQKVIKHWVRRGNSLVVQWLGLSAFIAVAVGSIPGSGTKIPQATQCSWKRKRKKKSGQNGALQTYTRADIMGSCLQKIHFLFLLLKLFLVMSSVVLK